MVYAHLQLGQDVRAKALVDAIAAMPRRICSIPAVTAITAIPRAATCSSAATGPAPPGCG